MKPGHIVQKLYPAINQCQILDAEVLKREKPQFVRQLNSLKIQFNKEFQILIYELSTIPQEVLLRGFMGEPTQHQSRRVSAYFMELQMEVSNKIAKLTDINNDIATRYVRIMCKIDYADLAVPTVRPNQGAAVQPSRSKYQPNPTFLEQGGNKGRTQPWYTTASDLMTKSDITIITEWLHSGGPYTQYSDPARFLKLLLDEETGRVLNTMLLDQCTVDNYYISVKSIVDTLDNLISS